MSESNNKYNWGDQLKQDVEAAAANPNSGAGRQARGPFPVGRHEGFVQAVAPETFKTGSVGIVFTYVFESEGVKGRDIKERIVMRKADGTPVKYSGQKLERRLKSLGLTQSQIAGFKYPRSEHDIGDFKLTIGAPVAVLVEEDKDHKTKQLNINPNTGLAYRTVKEVYSREIA